MLKSRAGNGRFVLEVEHKTLDAFVINEEKPDETPLELHIAKLEHCNWNNSPDEVVEDGQRIRNILVYILNNPFLQVAFDLAEPSDEYAWVVTLLQTNSQHTTFRLFCDNL